MESAIEGGLELPKEKLYVLGNSATFMSCDPTFNFGINNSLGITYIDFITFTNVYLF